MEIIHFFQFKLITLRSIGNVIQGGIKEQTHQSLTNMAEVLKSSGSGLNQVVKTTVFLKDMNDFVAMNDVYAQVKCTLYS